MGKKKQAASGRKPPSEDKPATLQEVLGTDTVAQLKARAEALKAEEAQKREEQRKLAEQERQAEQKQLENDFEYLLNNSKQDWKSFK
ncbi:DUF3886 domain-containing protein [Cohnella pontilimi]|uniref:DUF3886 domain-containing protein n=1 Tax=Cohnella pontilimi TaxID=2564100 RepID=A0A4U0FG13_9BACL|nr:YqkE family protein [Cohnella pontilimi]TJY43923.1 DUF3886 domain-containing protein [Cohnella pontilimi]